MFHWPPFFPFPLLFCAQRPKSDTTHFFFCCTVLTARWEVVAAASLLSLPPQRHTNSQLPPLPPLEKKSPFHRGCDSTYVASVVSHFFRNSSLNGAKKTEIFLAVFHRGNTRMDGLRNSLGVFQRSLPLASDSEIFLHLSFSWKWSLLVTRWNVCLTSWKGMDRQTHQRFPFFQFTRFYVLKTSCLPHFIGSLGREQKK